MRLRYIPVPHWPRLAWLATCTSSERSIEVRHGPGVETLPHFFCEAAWSGAFTAGDLDQAEVLTGSGGRLREEALTFVSPPSTIDRLQWLETGGVVRVSNSLACLLQSVEASVAPSYGKYNRDLSSVAHGLGVYKRTLATSVGDVTLVYHDNLVWNGRTLEQVAKPVASPPFTSYEVYTGFLQASLNTLADNGRAAERRVGRFDLLASISTGYDSPAVAVLARGAGCKDTLCIDRAQHNRDDDGSAIAEVLGYRIHRVSREAWRDLPYPEVPALAGGTLVSVLFAGAQDLLRGRILVTGYYGDKIWGMASNPQRNFFRGSCSGLGHTEYRLWAGYLHLPVPFLAGRRCDEIVAISNDPALEPWVIPGTTYNRPICRRLAEDAGVPREAFGRTKMGADLIEWQETEFLTPASFRDYLAWLRAHRGDWLRSGRLPPWASKRGDRMLNDVNVRLFRGVREAGAWLDKRLGTASGLRKRLRPERLKYMHPKLLNLRQHYFPWALERAKARYRGAPVGAAGS